MRFMVLPKLEPSTRVGDQVFEAIHDAIMSGEFPAGRRLQIRQLAAELGISVMPVREAIKRLEELGLVDAIPYRGAVVKRFTSPQLLQLYAVRRLLEVEATILGAPNITASDMERLRALLKLMGESVVAGRVVDYLDQDEEFLSILYTAASNPFLLELIGVLWRRCRSYKIVGAREAMETGQASMLLTYQERLVKAIGGGSPDVAGQITAESLDAATARIRHAFHENGDAADPEAS